MRASTGGKADGPAHRPTRSPSGLQQDTVVTQDNLVQVNEDYVTGRACHSASHLLHGIAACSALHPWRDCCRNDELQLRCNRRGNRRGNRQAAGKAAGELQCQRPRRGGILTRYQVHNERGSANRESHIYGQVVICLHFQQPQMTLRFSCVGGTLPVA